MTEGPPVLDRRVPRRREVLLGLGLATVTAPVLARSSEEIDDVATPPLGPPLRAPRPKAKLRGRQKRKRSAQPEAPELATAPLAVLVHRRLGFGQRPGDLEAFAALGIDDDSRLERWLDRQLDPDALPDVDPGVLAPGLRADEAFELHTVARRLLGRRQLFETLVAFWHDTLGVPDDPAAQRRQDDAVRAHALGDLPALLAAVGRDEMRVADVARRLAERLVGGADPELVDLATETLFEHAGAGDQLARTVRAMVLSPAFRRGWGRGRRTPGELALAALRLLDAGAPLLAVPGSARALLAHLRDLGQPVLGAAVPDAPGTPGSTLARARGWRLCNRLVAWRARSGRLLLDPLALTPSDERSAAAVVDGWCRRALGTLAPPACRRALIDFLAAGAPEHRPLRLDDPAARERLRSTVALVVMSPDFLAR